MKIRGGSYGYMLNMTQEILLMITAICIKEDKITLKDLFKEYERRGLFLDSYSQVEVIDLLGKLNLIDKKSDSGDAQYVKSIL
ncbi:dnd system-associated protein 1 [Clostridium sp. CAG:265]|nr:dnd system-associated protein 1 [Clostridium sp. CAG:265]